MSQKAAIEEELNEVAGHLNAANKPDRVAALERERLHHRPDFD